MNEQIKYETIKELVDHNGNKNRVAKKLGLSRRQINLLIVIYKEKGKVGFVHGNRTHKPSNALDKSISENIILLYRNKYQDWNFQHFKEFLAKEEDIHVSYDFIYKTLTKDGIISPKARKQTKRNLKMKQLLEKGSIPIKSLNLKIKEVSAILLSNLTSTISDPNHLETNFQLRFDD